MGKAKATTAVTVGILAAGALITPPSPAASRDVHVLHKGDSSVERTNGLRFRVRLKSVECRRTFPGMGLDPDTYEDTDAVARKGKKLCLLTLSVRNINRRPGFWYISGYSDALLRTSHRLAYADWHRPYSPGTIANLKGVEFSGDSDYIQPRETQYDFLLYEIPKRLRPLALEIPALT